MRSFTLRSDTFTLNLNFIVFFRYNMLGLALQHDTDTPGSLQESVRVYEEGIRLFPDRFELYANGGSAALDALDAQRSLNWFQAGLRLQPTSPELLNNLGLLYDRAAGDHAAEALHYYEHALSLLPDHPQIQQNVRNAHNAVSQQKQRQQEQQEEDQPQP